jgi:hypothetical protein
MLLNTVAILEHKNSLDRWRHIRMRPDKVELFQTAGFQLQESVGVARTCCQVI